MHSKSDFHFNGGTNIVGKTREVRGAWRETGSRIRRGKIRRPYPKNPATDKQHMERHRAQIPRRSRHRLLLRGDIRLLLHVKPYARGPEKNRGAISKNG